MSASLHSNFLTEVELTALGIKTVGKNVRLSDRATVYGLEHIEIGDNVRIDDFSVISAGPAGLRLGSYIHIASNCTLSARGGLVMEDFSGLSAGVRIFTSSSDYSGRHLTNPTVPKPFGHSEVAPVKLGRHVIIGANTVILPGVDIGEGSAVGACSLVSKNLAPWGVYFGTPVKRLKTRKQELLLAEAALLGRQS